MSAKEYLSQYRNLNTRVNAKCEQLARLRELSTKVSAGQGGGAPGYVSDRVGNIVAKICDAEREINAMIDRLIDLKAEIEHTIAAVPDETLRHLLELRYINGKTFEQIAVDMHYSWRHIIRIHGDALSAVRNVIECHIGSVLYL